MTEKPKWYSNLKMWREENGATGELWDIYVSVIQEKLYQYKVWFMIIGILFGIALSYGFYKLLGV